VQGFLDLQERSAADRDATAFSLLAEELRVFGVSCLGGALDASTTLLQAGGLTLRRGLSAGPAAPGGTGGGRSGSGRSGSGSSRKGGSVGRGGAVHSNEAPHAPVLLCCAADAGLDIVHVQRCVHSYSQLDLQHCNPRRPASHTLSSTQVNPSGKSSDHAALLRLL
jgi:hypothetical protein